MAKVAPTPKKKNDNRPPEMQNLTIENAKIAFRNFKGEAGRYNAEGQRNFCVLLDRDVAKDLASMGWNVKWLKPREDGDEPQPYMQVKVAYGNVPPKIVMITKKKTILDESNVHILDWAEMSQVDLIIRPYQWEVNDKKGVKAYVKTMYITLVQDEFAEKYEDIPDTASSVQEEDDDQT